MTQIRRGRAIAALGSAPEMVLVHLDADARPTYLFGRIQVCSTQGRPSPPEPSSGFVTDYTPFARGHVMALELGGPDVDFNIVPQWGQWQGGGAWRRMEEDIAARSGTGGFRTFVARLTYAWTGTTRDTSQAAFAAGQRLVVWDDRRIPTRIEVWATVDADPDGYFTALDDAKRIANAPAICGKLGAPLADWDHTGMPPIDRDYWRRQQIKAFLHREYDQYKTAHPAKVEAKAEALRTASVLGVPKTIKKASAPPPKILTKRSAMTETEKLMPLLPNGTWLVNEAATLAGSAQADAIATLGWTEAEKTALIGATLVTFATT